MIILAILILTIFAILKIRAARRVQSASLDAVEKVKFSDTVNLYKRYKKGKL